MAKGSNNNPPRPKPPAEPLPPGDWRNSHIWAFQPVRDLMILGAVVGLFYIGYLASVVTVPLLIAMLLAYLFEPLVRWMTRPRWVSRQGAVAAIIVVAALVVVVPMTVGVGFAVVQGANAAAAVSEVASNLLRVTRFADEYAGLEPEGREIIDKGSVQPAGKRFEFKAPERPEAPEVDEGKATDEGKDAGERREGDAPASQSPAVEAGLAGDAYAKLAKLGTLWTKVADAIIEQRMQDRQVAQGGVIVEPSALYRVIDMGLSWVQGHASVIGRQAIGTGAQAVGVALNTVRSIGLMVFGGFLTAFFFFFLSTGFGQVRKFWEGLIPERKKGRAFELLAEMDRVVSGFVRGRLLIAMILGVVYTIGYWLVGVPAPLILGPVVGLVTLVPYVALLGIPVCSLLMALEPSGIAWQTAWWWVLLAPAGVYALGQAMDDYLLSPIIQGKNTGMDMPTILFASLAGGALAGVYGLLLAIPIAACLRVLMKEVFWPRFRAWAEGRAEDVLPSGKH